MRTDEPFRDQTNVEDHNPPERPSLGISHFLGRLFDQLSLTSWFPAAVLVGNGAVLVQMNTNGEAAVGPAVQALTAQPLGILVVVAFALVIVTLVTQAFEYEVIQLLEGYDWARGPGTVLATARIRRHAGKLRRFKRKVKRFRAAAFPQAKQRMLAVGIDPAEVEVLEKDLTDPLAVDGMDPQLVEEARSRNWEESLAADVRYRLEALRGRLDGYPDVSRLLPTRLGNRLRAAEEKVPEGGERLQGFVVRYYDQLPPTLREEHDAFRRRLDMYCTLVLVFIALAAGSVVALHAITTVWLTAAVAVAYSILGWAAYEAAVASAKGYGAALVEIQPGRRAAAGRA